MTRVCSRCREEQPLENFYRNTRSKDGRTNTCKICKKQWAAKTRDKDIARARAWYENNKERARENTERWRAAHPDKLREMRRVQRRKAYALDPEKHRKRARDYSQAHPDTIWDRDMRRLAEGYGCVNTATYAEWLEILAQYGHKCYYCGDEGKMYTEHKTPLARGGPHAKDNLVPACNSCNVRKGRLTEEEFKDVLLRGALGRGDRAQRIASRLGVAGPFSDMLEAFATRAANQASPPLPQAA